MRTDGASPRLRADAARSQAVSALVEQIRSAGGEVRALEADMFDPDAPGAIFDAAESEWGPVSILINNAGASAPDTFLVTETDRMGRSLNRTSAAIDADGLSIALPSQVAEVVACLCSAQASGVSGNIIQMR